MEERNIVDITYEIPPCDTQGLFFDDSANIKKSPKHLVNSNSLIDEQAVFSILQFGAIVPPLSPWKGIRRLLPGYKYHDKKMIGPVSFLPRCVSRLDTEAQINEIEKLIDIVLRRLIGDKHDPVLLFSGGIDSGFIASRLVALGYRDSLLVNYSFGREDKESQLAELMANRLGLKFKRIMINHNNICDCLTNPGRVYSQPFGDISTIPTSDLAHAVVELLSGQKRLILDGTGADGAFGMLSKIKNWQNVIRIPAIIRKAISSCYGIALWNLNGRAELLPRIFRRSTSMPLLSAILAQNPLAGILYRKSARNTVDGFLGDWIGGWAGQSLVHRIVAGDLALTCSNIFAQKAKPILESAGHTIAYPFLENDIVFLAFRSIDRWKMKEPKEPLKQSLARFVPHNMVYRPKSGFVNPHEQVLTNQVFIDYLRTAVEPSGPISHLIEKKPLIKACKLLSCKKKLPYQTLNCIWTIAFTDRWYRTAR